MAETVVMPKLGLLMERGTVSDWKVREGDQVSVGSVIAEITTEKITYELESQAEGVVLKIILPEGEEAEVGAPIALIGQPGEEVVWPAGAPSAAAAVVAGETGATSLPAVPTGVGTGGRVLASPAAKKLASELGVDLTRVRGTGPGGRVTLEDVKAAAAAAEVAGVATAEASGGGPLAGVTVSPQVFATPMAKKLAAELGVDLATIQGAGPGGRVRSEDVTAAGMRAAGAAATPPGVVSATTGTLGAGSGIPSIPSAALSAAAIELRGGVAQEIPYAGMRRLIGEHMDASHKLAPMVTYQVLADVEELKRALARINAGRRDEDKISVTAVVVKAAALVLRKMPCFNSTLDGEVIRVWRNVNVGVAVALADGLIVPVVREADRKSISEIAREIRTLASRARENKLLPDEVSGGTFTVTTLGSYHSVDFFNPIINQPEAAILGVGRMQDTVTAVGGTPTVRATMGLSLTCDHRLIDGAPAAEFLRALMEYLAEPLTMLL